MKKMMFLGFIAFTALSVTSCSNDEVMEAVPQKQAIEFGTYLGRDAQARGTVLTTSNMVDFGVFAYYTGQNTWTASASVATPNFMYNQKVNVAQPESPATERTYSYSPLKYWPTTKDDKISFFAYAPYVGTENGALTVANGNTAKGLPQMNYTIKSSYLDKAEDFVVAVLVDEQKLTGNTLDNSDQTVSFNFKHVLTRVNINAKLSKEVYNAATTGTNSEKKTKVNITKIEFSGNQLATKGLYTFSGVDGGVGTWEIIEKANIDLDVLLKKVYASGLGDYTESGVQVVNATAVPVLSDNQYLYLIPIDGDGLDAITDEKMTVYYDIVTQDAALSGGYSKTSAIKEIPLTAGQLKLGKAYLYTLIFGMNEVKLEVSSVEEWGNENEEPENVDWTDTDKS